MYICTYVCVHVYAGVCPFPCVSTLHWLFISASFVHVDHFLGFTQASFPSVMVIPTPVSRRPRHGGVIIIQGMARAVEMRLSLFFYRGNGF